MSKYELRYHNAMPGWCKIIGLEIRKIHKCEGGGVAFKEEDANKMIESLNKSNCEHKPINGAGVDICDKCGEYLS